MRFANGLTTILVLFLAAMGIYAPAIAATFNVSDVAGLRAALQTAATNGADDVIVLAAGTYATGGTTFSFVTNEPNTLILRGAPGTTRDQVVLDGGGTSQVMNFSCVGSCGAITLQGLTVQNGSKTTGSGGGLNYSNVNLVISDVAFLGNRAQVGAGGAIFGGATGGVALTLTVTNSTFSNNTAGGGGAISTSAGGVYVNVTNSTFSNNTAGGGGAISSSWTVTVTSSLFRNNSATANGGAIEGSGIIASNNTFSGNAAAGSGAAIYMRPTSSIINSVFYGHSTPAIYATSAYNLYNNLIDTSTGIAGSIPIMVGNVAPGTKSPFIDAKNGNFRLAAGSLAIDAGLDPNSTTFANLVGSNNVADIRKALLTDLDGNPRPRPGTAVDIGAYEFGSVSPETCLFSWAESQYPQLFPGTAVTQFFAPYDYRYYAATDTYLGNNTVDLHIWAILPTLGLGLTDLGPSATWFPQAQAAGCR